MPVTRSPSVIAFLAADDASDVTDTRPASTSGTTT